MEICYNLNKKNQGDINQNYMVEPQIKGNIIEQKISEGKIQINLRQSVKSEYIIKEIFSFLDEREKLNIISYNKKYQELFAVNIEHYKKISGRCKEGEKNGKGKEYSLDEKLDKKYLIFEGEYKNGKRHGKGKEYNYDELIFEGEIFRW